MAGLETLVESVYHPMFRNFDSEFGDVLGRGEAGAPGDEIVLESHFEQDIGHGDEVGIALLFGHQDVASGRDCVELIPLVTWFDASWGQLVCGAGIGPQWGPGEGGGVPPESTLVRCGNSIRDMDNELFDQLSDLMDCFDLLCCDYRRVFPRTGYGTGCLMRGDRWLHVFALMCLI